MKILTKYQQKKLMNDLLDLYLFGSDALKAIGTHRPMTAGDALQRQMKMIDAAMDAANIIEGQLGMALLMEADKQKRELEALHGFPLEMKTETNNQKQE